MTPFGPDDPEPTLRDRDRLARRLDVSAGPVGCWPYQGAPNEHGYRRLRVCGQVTYAHRAAYRMAVGPIPDDLWVLHHCDNPPCCNPRHLFLGTVGDNVRDAMSKGRMPHFSGWLYADEVEVIRRSGDRALVLAARFRVSIRTIYRALQPDYVPRNEKAIRKRVAA